MLIAHSRSQAGEVSIAQVPTATTGEVVPTTEATPSAAPTPAKAASNPLAGPKVSRLHGLPDSFGPIPTVPA